MYFWRSLKKLAFSGTARLSVFLRLLRGEKRLTIDQEKWCYKSSDDSDRPLDNKYPTPPVTILSIAHMNEAQAVCNLSL
jgi:hypothetical protein